LDSTGMLKSFLPKFTKNMVEGIAMNKQRIDSYLESSPVLVTFLTPYIGYMKASEIYKEAENKGMSVRDIVLLKGLMSKEQLDNVFTKNSLLGGK
jgi:aspartate ammonia-lyase